MTASRKKKKKKQKNKKTHPPAPVGPTGTYRGERRVSCKGHAAVARGVPPVDYRAASRRARGTCSLAS